MKHHPAHLAAILAATVLAGTPSSAAIAESDRSQIPEKEETLGLMSGVLIGANDCLPTPEKIEPHKSDMQLEIH